MSPRYEHKTMTLAEVMDSGGASPHYWSNRQLGRGGDEDLALRLDALAEYGWLVVGSYTSHVIGASTTVFVFRKEKTDLCEDCGMGMELVDPVSVCPVTHRAHVKRGTP